MADEHDQLKIEYNRAFSENPAVLEDLLTFCHFFEPSDEMDPNVRAIKDGRRDVATYLLQRMGITSESFINGLLDA